MLLIAAAAVPLSVSAALTASDEPGIVSHRHLLVVETSRAMQRRAPAVQAVLSELLSSGIQGQLREGDTLGIWTFSDDLRTGQFPLQHWSTNAAKVIAQRLVRFVQAQTNDGPARLEKVIPALQKLVEDSEFLTVILVTSGEQSVLGTPFDENINATFRIWQAEQQKTQCPFVTVLRAVNAQVVDCAVTPAPWPIELPPFPPELRERIAAAMKKPAGRPKPATPAPATKALVFSGRDPTPGDNETRNNATVRREAVKPETAIAETAIAETANVEAPKAKLETAGGEGPKAEPAKPEAPKAGTAWIEAPKTQDLKTKSQQTGTAKAEPPRPEALGSVGTEVAKTEVPKPETSAPWAPPKSNASPLLAELMIGTQAAEVATAVSAPEAAQPVEPGHSVPAPPSVAAKPGSAKPAANQPEGGLVQPAASPAHGQTTTVPIPVKTATASETSAARAVPPPTAAPRPTTPPQLVPSATVVHARETRSNSLTQPPAPEIAAATPQAPPWVPRAIGISGAAMALTGVILVFMRKPRPTRGSLITRSLERDFGP